MARGIKLRRYEITEINHYYIHGYRLKVDVAEVADGMVPEIFVFERLPANPDTGVVEDEFKTIASFVDLAEYSVGAPDPRKGLPYFRTSSVELDLRSMTDVETVWGLIVSLAANLCLAMDRADQLVPAEEQWAGHVPDGQSSESDL